MPVSNATITCYFHLYNQTGDHTNWQILKNDPYSDHYTINEWAYSANGNNFSTIGKYAWEAQCNGTVNYGGCADKGTFDVTSTGEAITEGNAYTLMILLFIILLIFAITTYGAIIMPWKNIRNEEDKVISINDLKYLKIVLWVIAYLEMLFVVLIVKNIAYGIELFNASYQFFNIVFWFMLILLLPFFPLLVWFTILTWITDKKVQENLSRGLRTE